MHELTILKGGLACLLGLFVFFNYIIYPNQPTEKNAFKNKSKKINQKSKHQPTFSRGHIGKNL